MNGKTYISTYRERQTNYCFDCNKLPYDNIAVTNQYVQNGHNMNMITNREKYLPTIQLSAKQHTADI